MLCSINWVWMSLFPSIYEHSPLPLMLDTQSISKIRLPVDKSEGYKLPAVQDSCCKGRKEGSAWLF